MSSLEGPGVVCPQGLLPAGSWGGGGGGEGGCFRSASLKVDQILAFPDTGGRERVTGGRHSFYFDFLVVFGGCFFFFAAVLLEQDLLSTLSAVTKSFLPLALYPVKLNSDAGRALDRLYEDK